MVLSCLEVKEASSNAISSPRPVSIIAEVFIINVIDITGVLYGIMFDVINSPAIMLPQAKRFRGLIRAVLFSLIGLIEINRG